MPASLIEGESLLALDIGAATTRAVLFDVVEGQYRFVAAGQAPTSAEAPFKDVSEGVRAAIRHLETITGKTLLDETQTLIVPTQPNGSGVDALVATLSAGPTLRAVVVGLLPEVSIESARRLTETIYARLVETISLNDHRRADQQLDALLRLRPDVVVVTGGTDGGASRSVQKMLEPIGLAAYLLPAERRPFVLFAGNQKIQPEVKALLGSLASSLYFSPNIRPSLETEDLEPAARELARLFVEVRKKQLKGVDLIDSWATGHTLPTGYALGRMMRFLSKVYGSAKGILSVDIGASATTIAAGFKEKATLGVYPQFGLGENLPGLLSYTSVDEIMRWLPLDIPASMVRDALHQMGLYPTTIPATREDQAIVQAVARQMLRLAFRTVRKNFPPHVAHLRHNLTPLFDPILASGGILADAANAGQSLLLLLDGIQPVGVTTVILDQNNLLPLLGAAAERNSLLPVQVLESGAFLSVGTVVSPVVSASYGATILRARLTYEDGTEARTEVKSGTLDLLPLATGQVGQLHLQPARGVDVGFGPGRSGTLTVSGGTLGVVFDGRGRPLNLPADAVRRRELIKKWHWTLGG